jgi:hypothetical protein
LRITNKRTPQTSIVVPPKILKKVERDAIKEKRTRAGMLSKIIIEHYEKEE